MTGPMLDDSQSRLDERRGVVWGSLRVVGGQLERMIAVNLGWSLQLLPGLSGLIFARLPLPLRLLLITYSLVVLPIATGVLHQLAADAVDGEHLGLPAVRDAIRQHAWTSFAALTPLIALLIALVVAAAAATSAGLTLLAAVAELGILLLSVCSMWWGPLLVRTPQPTARTLLSRSVQLFLRFPAVSLGVAGVCLLLAALGAITGAWILIAVSVIAVTQARLGERLEGNRR